MKRFSILLVLMALLLCACGGENPTAPQTTPAGASEFVFEAEVTEVGENTITVMPDDKYKEAGVALDVGLIVIKTDVIPDVKVGDHVRIEYDGVITRSIPGQLGDVYKLEVID